MTELKTFEVKDGWGEIIEVHADQSLVVPGQGLTFSVEGKAVACFGQWCWYRLKS